MKRPQRARAFRAGVLLAVFAVVAGCGTAQPHGIELGQLRTKARRVEGGGIECPLSIRADLLRPPNVSSSVPVTPMRSGANSASGVIGTGLPTRDSVQIACAYSSGGVRIDLTVLGVPKGHVLAAFAPQLRKLIGSSEAVGYIDANAQVPVGQARAIPGRAPAAFARVATAKGDVGVIVVVSASTPGARLPSAADVVTMTGRLASSLAN